jgi:hypothetical protein
MYIDLVMALNMKITEPARLPARLLARRPKLKPRRKAQSGM